MKTTIASIVLALAAGQAYANGFYQEVVGHANCPSQEISGKPTEFTFTPLYNRVVGNRQKFNDGSQDESRVDTKTAQTPLYAKVMGNAS